MGECCTRYWVQSQISPSKGVSMVQTYRQTNAALLKKITEINLHILDAKNGLERESLYHKLGKHAE